MCIVFTSPLTHLQLFSWWLQRFDGQLFTVCMQYCVRVWTPNSRINRNNYQETKNNVLHNHLISILIIIFTISTIRRTSSSFKKWPKISSDNDKFLMIFTTTRKHAILFSIKICILQLSAKIIFHCFSTAREQLISITN